MAGITFTRTRWSIASLPCAILLLAAGRGAAGDDIDQLKELYEAQARQLAALKQEVQKVAAQRAAQQPPPAAGQPAGGGPPAAAAPKTDEDAVKKIVAGYLRDNPGAGMPAGVQTGYAYGQGFRIASAPTPAYANWDDDSKIPFEIRFRGRLMLSYMNYKTTDRDNHVTNIPATANVNSTRLADFSQLEVKRVNLIWYGSVFDPDLHFNVNLLGSTRGLPGLQNNKVVQTAGAFDPNTAAVSPLGGGVLVDHAVTLFEGWISYDFHPCWGWLGCGHTCPDGTYKYVPTFTLIGGKLKPFFCLDEYLGNGNQQFCDFSMADLYFSADDDTRLMGAGVQVKAFDDRFFLQAIATNGSEGTLQPNSQMDNYPGFIAGWWYDLGGSWDPEKKAWNLYGDCISDVDYSCRPVVRLGTCVDLVPMNRRSLYGDAEQSRFFVMPAAPGGTRLINVLNGDAAAPNGAHDVDKFDAYELDAFVAGKYRGLSVYNEWWVRDLNDFHTTPNGRDAIIYQSTLGPGGAARNALFTAPSLVDYGMAVSAGYFLIPRKLEVAARWSWVRGESGDINGTGRVRNIAVPGVTGPVQVVAGAFRQFHEADEYTIGINYYFRRQLLKWQTDFAIYQGGNPAAGGTPIAGWIPGQDGWLFRTQLQLAF